MSERAYPASAGIRRNARGWTGADAPESRIGAVQSVADIHAVGHRVVHGGERFTHSVLITDDVLARLPYKEHPANLALVARLGRELGLSEEFMFKEIADHLVPDLGVLRTYPRIYSRGRSAIFSNGMSANERLGALGNWRRLGFGEHTPRQRPGEWFVIVINNRADRIPRSKVFAAVMAEDVNPHRFIVIGTNVTGMAGYVEDALGASAGTIIISDRRGAAAVQDWLGRFCDKLKIVGRHPQDLALAARRVLLGCGQTAEAIAAPAFLASRVLPAPGPPVKTIRRRW